MPKRGRDPRFVHGWWIVPCVLLAAVLWAKLIWLVFGGGS